MTRFRCQAPGCQTISSRSRPPASCPDKGRCDLRAIEDDAAAAPTAQAEPIEPSEPALSLRDVELAPPAPAATPLEIVFDDGTVCRVEQMAVLGRNGTVHVERFRADLSVSRQHCRLETQPGGWQLVVLADSPTRLNGALLPRGRTAAISGAATLQLGDNLSLRLRPAPAEVADSDGGGALEQLLRNIKHRPEPAR